MSEPNQKAKHPTMRLTLHVDVSTDNADAVKTLAEHVLTSLHTEMDAIVEAIREGEQEIRGIKATDETTASIEMWEVDTPEGGDQ